MKITSIPQMTEITINMVHNGVEIQVSTRVLTSYGGGLLVTPMYCEDNQLIDYCYNGSFEYKDPFSGNVHRFNIESITRTDLGGANFNLILAKEEMVIEKKRKAERYMVQQKGVAVVNKKDSLGVVVNDISMRGVSVLIGSEGLVNVGDELRLTFNRDDAGFKRIVIQCKVVRIFKIHGIPAAGCVFSGVSTDLLGYVQGKKANYDHKQNVKVAG